MLRACVAAATLAWLVLGGCPGTTDDNAAVDAVITISSTRGPAPLTVVVSADQSTSTNVGDLQYAWNFDDDSTSTDQTVTHTFTEPGRYIIKLTVTDALDEKETVSQELRVAGSGAVAVIVASAISGDAPLFVQFDGTQSFVPDDTILNYTWDFGDGGESAEAEPHHTFSREGEYTVRLTIETAGGIEAETSTTVAVGAANAALQFNGASLATLPLGSERTLEMCTVEAWVKPENDGGIAVSVGNGELVIELRPNTNTITLRAKGNATDAAATNLAGIWRHVAAVYNGAGATGTCVLYIDGSAIGQVDASGALTPSQITIGNGYRGRIADVRFWGAARSSVDIATDRGERLTGAETNLIGYWPIIEGAGQTLNNAVSGAPDGVLGASTSAETADPAWSADGPPL